MQGIQDRDIRPRIDAPELLDQGAGTDADARENLLEMARLNRLFGGAHSLTRHLYPRLKAIKQPAHIVDIGTGSGDIAMTVSRWARRRGLDVTVYPLDISARNLRVARDVVGGAAGVHLLQADALALPFAAGGYDYAISSLMLHHLSQEQLIALIRETYRKARRGIIFTDLTRGRLALAGFDLIISPLFARHRFTKHDGHVSIQRAYTPDELRAMAREAGIEGATVHAHFPFRMTLVADKADV